MARRKITEEAEQKAEEQQKTGSEGGGSDSDERMQLTQRMPADLVEDVDEYAEEMALPSRNAAINFLVRQALPDE